MNFLSKLDKLMAQANLNKRTFSIASGIPYTTIDGWYKKGYEKAKMDNIQKVASYFNTSLDYLMNDDVEDKEFLTHTVNNEFDLLQDELELIKKYRTLKECEKNIIQLILNSSND